MRLWRGSTTVRMMRGVCVLLSLLSLQVSFSSIIKYGKCYMTSELVAVPRSWTLLSSLEQLVCSCVYTCTCMHNVYIHVLIRDEKERRKKQARSNKQQGKTAHPRQSLF